MTTSKKSEQIVAIGNANAEALLTMARRALDSIEKLATLNFNTIREGIHDSAKNAEVLTATKDPKELLSVQSAIAAPTLDNVRNFYHNAYDVLLEAQRGITEVMEAHYRTLSEGAESAIEETKSKMPAGGDIFASTMKSLLQANSEAFDRLNFMAQQAVQIADSNMKTLAASIGAGKKPASSATAKAAGSATKKAASKV
ncbi:MAG: phasin family protein [Zoogloeaceae bacterium]|jgi:phasin family protein|nr:phasin family protein [Zoogloeaceae bacterium]